jgi:glycosyltransferase involved in cell wall biosynthesis
MNTPNKKIKICHCVSADITLKFLLLEKLKFLRGLNYDVYATCSPGKWVESLKKEGIKIKTIGFKRKAFSPFSDIISFFRLYFYFKKEKFCIVHTHTLKPEFFGQIAAKLAGVPVIINTLHGFDFAEEDSFFKKKLIIFLETISAKCSDIVLSIASHISERAIKERIVDAGEIKYFGRDINIERFNQNCFDKKFVEEKKKELGISEGDKVIGIVARMVKEKGYLELFEAFNKIIFEFPDTALLVIGPLEPEKNDAITPEIVKNYGIEDKVFFAGDQEKVEEFYAIMDIFVLPTHREGLGASILEASSMEKPVIVSNVGGCPEAVEDGKTGLLVPVRDVKKLTGAIIFLLKNKDTAKAMGKAGREKVFKEFKQEIVFGRMEDNYREIMIKKVKQK